MSLIGDGNPNVLNGGGGTNHVWGGGDADTLSSHGDLHGEAGNDTLISFTNSPDTLDGGADSDTAVFTRNSNVSVDLNSPTANTDGDTLTNIENLTGGNGDDTLTGDGTANIIKGGLGNDTLVGNAGDDTLDGGPGNADVAWGGTLSEDDGFDTCINAETRHDCDA